MLHSRHRLGMISQRSWGKVSGEQAPLCVKCAVATQTSPSPKRKQGFLRTIDRPGIIIDTTSGSAAAKFAAALTPPSLPGYASLSCTRTHRPTHGAPVSWFLPYGIQCWAPKKSDQPRFNLSRSQCNDYSRTLQCLVSAKSSAHDLPFAHVPIQGASRASSSKVCSHGIRHWPSSSHMDAEMVVITAWQAWIPT